MLRKKQKLMLLISSWALISCQTPPNFTACTNLVETGHCASYISKKKFDIDNDKKFYTTLKGEKLKWDQVVAGSVLIPADWFAELKTYFDNFCHQNTCPNNIGDWNSFANELMPKKNLEKKK